SADLMTLFRPDTGTPAIPNAVCAVQRTNDDLPPFDAGFYIVASIMGIIAFISILAGAVDYGLLRMGQDFFSEFLMNSYFAVDSFYFMSGLLLTFTWFKNYQKNPQATNSPLSWVLFYVHRLIRWYLASEMQIFLFTPLFILPLAIKPAIGFIVAAAALIISTGTNIFLVYHYHWPLHDQSNGFYISIFWRAMYSSLSRIAWGLG
ncbi:hypothetical protein PMAYCL1PPCAC_16211, partial [Pristionchus mayeri]